MSRIGFAGDSAGAMLALASALWLRDKQIDCGKIAGVLLWYGLYGLRDSVTRRLLGGVWDGLTQQDLQMYEEAYLSNDGTASRRITVCLIMISLAKFRPVLLPGRSSIRCWMTAVCFTRR